MKSKINKRKMKIIVDMRIKNVYNRFCSKKKGIKEKF